MQREKSCGALVLRRDEHDRLLAQCSNDHRQFEKISPAS